MKITTLLSIALLGLLISPALAAGPETTLEQNFAQPPASAKPHTWWHWMNGNITKEGITADLEAMKRVGIGGAQSFNVGDGIPAGPVNYMSPAWRALAKHAITEADRLGLEICLHNCPGWSASGGPWITPEYAMQQVVFAEKQIQGPLKFSGEIEPPKGNLGFYRDIAVLAFPTPAGEAGGKGFRIADWESKAGMTSKNKSRVAIAADQRPVAAGDVIAPDKVIDLTGRKTWDVPAGNWTLVRFGYTPVGTLNRTPPDSGKGLECDKLSRAAAKFHWSESMGNVIADVGPLAGKSFNNVLIDSYEVGTQNWTPQMAAQFRQRRGYDLLPYLPCLTGRVVGSLDRSERFLWDFRRTLADLFVSEYVGTFQELCHQNGLLLSIEPYGPGNFNHLEIAALADIPMGEFWTAAPSRYGWTGRLAASSANANGRKFVGAESFTSGPDVAWSGHPGNLKTEGDHFFCEGINRFIFHTFVHQPWMNVLPGMTMGPHGMQGNRNNTWFEQGAAWMTYLARCQYLLQEGRSVKDICYVLGEDSPVGNSLPERAELRPAPPQGYDYDFVDAGTVLKLSVKDGQLVLPSGMTYRALVLLPGQGMRPALARKLNELIEAGAPVVGPRPTHSPSLENYPNADAEVKELGAAIAEETLGPVLAKIRLAPDAQFQSREGTAKIEYLHRQIGDMDVYFVSNQKDQPVTVEGSFRVSGREPELWHPDTGRMEAAPVCRQTPDRRTSVTVALDQAGSVFVVFRQPARADSVVSITRDGLPVSVAELHREGDTLTVRATQRGDYVAETALENRFVAKVAEVPAPVELAGPWQVKFPAGWGAPEQIQLDKLISWTKHENPDVKHFSGTATYETDFKFQISDSKSHTLLDLGRVEVMAEVWLNGKNLGVVWKAPFQVDVTRALRAGGNHLEVRVVNLWINRLIGDAALPEDAKFDKMSSRGSGILEIPEWLREGKPRPATPRQTFATWHHFTAQSPLVESGLLGPVRLVFEQVALLK